MKHFLLIAILALVVKSQIVYNSNIVPKEAEKLRFLSYTAQFGKTYSNTTEFDFRISNFIAVDTFINNYDELGVVLGHNNFSDWSPEERQKILGRKSLTRRLNEFEDDSSEKNGRNLFSRYLQTTNVTNGTNSTNTTNSTCQPSTGFFLAPCGYGCKSCFDLNWCNACWSRNFNLSKGICSCATKQVNDNITECYYCKPGQYWNTTSKTCESCVFGCNICTNGTTCGTCKPNFSKLSTGQCFCPTNNINFWTGDCLVCNQTSYFDGNSTCLRCPANCTSCQRLNGTCNNCTAPFSVLANNTCGCAPGTMFIRTTSKCVPIVNCTAGTFFQANNTCARCSTNCTSCESLTGNCLTCSPNFTVSLTNNKTCVRQVNCSAGTFLQANNTCAPCGSNCTSCETLTGKCLSCTSNYTFSTQNNRICLFNNCTYKIGPVGNQTYCLNSAFNSSQIVAPFDANSTSVDWRILPVMWGIQEQGKCGSCYAFSAIASLESAWAIKTGNLYKLSEQHIVDCDPGNFGCDGGNQNWALDFLGKNGTILSSDYNYTSEKSGLNGTCMESGKARVFQTSSPTNYKVKSDIASFKSALRQQPLIISFAVGDDFMQFKSGIYTGAKCATQMNHAMTAVAYGIEKGVEYVVIKNQWGVNWGEQGYIKVALTSSITGVCQLYSDNYVTLV